MMRTSIPLCCAALLCLYGCAGSSNSGRLSDAMRAASDDNTGSREVPSGREVERDPVADEDSTVFRVADLISSFGRSIDAPAMPGMRVPDGEGVWLSVGAGTGSVSEPALRALNEIDLRLGLPLSERSMAVVNLSGGRAGMEASHPLAKSIDDGVLLFSGGMQFNYFTTPPHTFVGQYFIFGWGVDYMSWSYRNTIGSAGRSISGDGLWGGELLAGVGVNFVQTPRFRFGAEATAGGVLWIGDTYEGFANDVFQPWSRLKIRCAMSVRL